MADASITTTTNIDGGASNSAYGTTTLTAGSASTPNTSFPGALIIDGGNVNG